MKQTDEHQSGNGQTSGECPGGSGPARAARNQGDLMSLAGVFRHATHVRLTDDELDAAIRNGYADRGMRGLGQPDPDASEG